MNDTKAVGTTHPAPLMVWTDEQVNLIKRTIAVGATNDELALFGYICQRTGLDPFVRQIYAIKRGGKMTFQTGIDGYRMIADSTNNYAGSDDPIYLMSADGKIPISATVTVYKFVQGERCPFTATARWEEYCPTDTTTKDQSMWKKMPCGQLGKCAESLALRKAFPMKLSGLCIDEEMQQADTQQEGGPYLLPVGVKPASTPTPTTIEDARAQEGAHGLGNTERAALLHEIAALCKEAIVPLRHTGMRKAIYWHSFRIESPGYIHAQPLETLERGIALYRHLTAQLLTWDQTTKPDEWIAEQQRILATQAAGDEDLPDGVDPETGEDHREMPDGWLTDEERQAQRDREEAALLDQANA